MEWIKIEYCDYEKIIKKLLNSNFKNDIMELDEVWLRKEIIKKH